MATQSSNPQLPLIIRKTLRDGSCERYGAFLVGVSEPVAAVSVFDNALQQLTPDGGAGCVPALRFEELACDLKYRHQGIGTRLLQHVFNDALSESQTPALVVWCDARIDAVEWFEREDIGMGRFGGDVLQGRPRVCSHEAGVDRRSQGRSA